MEIRQNEDKGFDWILDESEGLLGNMTHVLQQALSQYVVSNIQ